MKYGRCRSALAAPAVLAVAVGALSSASALGKATVQNIPLRGTESGTTTNTIATGSAIDLLTIHLSHLGKFTARANAKMTLTGPGAFTVDGKQTIVAASGDKLFSRFKSAGSFTGVRVGSTIHTTSVNAITGGTGCFARATGKFTVKVSSVITSISSSIVTAHDTGSLKGRITLKRAQKVQPRRCSHELGREATVLRALLIRQ